MKPDDVSQGCWDDFLAHRKQKRAIVTERVINRIRDEADLAGYTLEEALNECVDRGWQGFKAEWVQKVSRSQRKDVRDGIFGDWGNVIDLGNATVKKVSIR
jgi:hypothetical protein